MAAPTRIGGTTKAGPSGGGAAAGVDLTGADLIVVLTSSYSATTGTLSDNSGRTYTPLTRRTNTAGFDVAGQIFYCANPTGDLSNVVVTFAASALYPAFAVEGWEFGGATVELDSGTDLGNNNGNAASSTSKPGAVTPSVDGALIVVEAAYESASPCTIDAGFTERQDAPLVGGSYFGSLAATLPQTTAATVDPTVTYAGSNANVTCIAVFIPAGASAQDVTLPTIASGAVVRTPTVAPGAVALAPPAIASAAVVRAPTIAYRAALPTLASAAVAREPSLAVGAVGVSLPTLASGAALNTPTVTLGGLLLPTLASGAALSPPTLRYAVALPTLAAGSAPFPPAVALEQALLLPTIAAGAALSPPTLGLVVALPTRATAAVLNPPTLIPEALLELPALASGTVLSSPAVSGGTPPPTTPPVVRTWRPDPLGRTFGPWGLRFYAIDLEVGDIGAGSEEVVIVPIPSLSDRELWIVYPQSGLASGVYLRNAFLSAPGQLVLVYVNRTGGTVTQGQHAVNLLVSAQALT